MTRAYRTEHDSHGRGPGASRGAVAGADPAGGGELPDQRHADRAGADPRHRRGQGGRGAGQRRARRARRRARAGRSSGAAREVAAGDHDDAFPIDVFQTGSGTSSNMNANEVIASLAGSGRRRGAPQRPRQRLPVVQRHLPDRDPRRRVPRGDRRPAAGARRPGRLAGGQGDRVRRPGEVRPHPPHGRDAGDARPGARRLRRDGPATPPSGSSRCCPGCGSCRWAAPPSGPASTRPPASPSG